MDSEQLKVLIKEKENLTLEFKEHYTSKIDEDIVDDRIVITNPGTLAKGLQEKEFGKISVRRNELLADLFFRMHKVEKAGTGIQRMQDKMKEFGLPEPEYTFDTFFTVAISRIKEPARKIQVSLTENQELILSLFRKNPKFTQNKVAKEVGISDKAIRKNILKLRDLGLIEHLGSRKAGEWKVK